MTTSTSSVRINTPTTLEGADKLIGILESAQARIDSVEARADAEIARIKESLRVETKSDRDKVARVMGKLLEFADKNRGQIVTKDGKSVEVTNGTLALRLGNISVDCKDDEKLIETLKRMGLAAYVRVRESLDRELLLAEREILPRIPGLSFLRKERLHVKPVGASEVVKTKNVKL